MRLIPQYDVIDSPERFTELTWEGLKNYAGNRGGMDATQSAAWASKIFFKHNMVLLQSIICGTRMVHS